VQSVTHIPGPGRELAKLEEEYLALVHKNMEIEAACRQTEREIEAAQVALGRQPASEQAQPMEEAQGAAEGAPGGAAAGAEEEAAPQPAAAAAAQQERKEGEGGTAVEEGAAPGEQPQQQAANGEQEQEQAADGPMSASEPDAMQE
jgi:hypothetical protein